MNDRTKSKPSAAPAREPKASPNRAPRTAPKGGYAYVGPERLRGLALEEFERFEPEGPGAAAALAAWMRRLGLGDWATVTYVVTLEGRLRVSERFCEHVACAQGRDVLAAGELSLVVDKGRAEVESVTNQSTGYCPEPRCFGAVAAALEAAGLEAPEGFEHAFVFRRCEACGGISIVKEGVFECAECGASLPQAWNFG